MCSSDLCVPWCCHLLLYSLHWYVYKYTDNSARAPPKTMTREYQEQMTARAKENNLNPLYGISSEGYKGKGHVTV